MKRAICLFAFALLTFALSAQAGQLAVTDFEDGKTGPWQGRGSAILKTSTESARSGVYSLLTTGRSDGWHGPQIDLSGKVLTGGTYRFSVWVRIMEGQPDSEMIMTVQRERGGTQSWDRVLAANVKAGIWTNLAGDYSSSSQFDKAFVYIESSNTTLAYYIDDFSAVVVKPAPEQEAAAWPSGLDVPSLADAFRTSFVVGAAVELDQLQGPEGALLLRHFSGLTAENIMKPQYIAPAEDIFNFDSADKLVDFAAANGKLLRGHTLLWHTQNARWMFYDAAGNFVSKDVLLARLEKYITTVVSRYRGKVYAWDVVNEVVDGTGYRQSEWYNIAGEEYIEKAFVFARKADPAAKLFINDYDTTEKNKENQLYTLVKRLLEKNIPVDGVGMQFHITLDYPSTDAIKASLKRFSDLGLEIHITELDVSVNGDPNLKADSAPEELLIRQAYRYKEIFDIFKSFRNITNVTFWGFQDGHTWLVNHPVAKADWPLLFDRDLNPKLAYWALVDPSRLPADVVLTLNRNDRRAAAPKGTPVIDGIEDAVWRNAGEMKIDIYVQGSGAYGAGKALWDENNLYVFVTVTDPKLSKLNANAWEQDSVEIFVDEKNNKSADYMADDAQYRFNFENYFSYGGTPAKVTSAARITRTGYDVEVKIPLQTIRGAEGTVIGFDLQINDDAGSGARDSLSKWNDPTNESYRNTSGFGTLTFVR